MSEENLSGVDVDMTESLVNQELDDGVRSTTGVTDEIRNAQLEVKYTLCIAEYICIYIISIVD